MSSIIKTTHSTHILCPNHGCPLEGMGFPLPKKGVGMCPVSGAHFEFEAEVQEDKMVQNKDGTITKAKGYKLTGDDN